MQLMQQHACRRKQLQMQARLEELGTDSLEERLQMATEMPSPAPYRLSTAIQVGLPGSAIAATAATSHKHGACKPPVQP